MPNIPEIKIGNTTYKLKDGDLREHIVENNNSQPSNENNRIWVKPSQNDVRIPTWDEFSNVVNALGAEEFDSTKEYKNGQYVWHDDVFYQFIMDRPAGTWDSGYCKEADVVEDLCNSKIENRNYADTIKFDIGEYFSYIPYIIDGPGVYDWNMNLNTGITNGVYLTAAVKGNHKYRISGQRWAKSYPAAIFLNNNTIIGYDNAHVPLGTRFVDVDIVTPSNCNKIIINGIGSGYDTGAPMIKEISLSKHDAVFIPCKYTVETGVYDSGYNLNTAVGVHAVYNVSSGDIIRYSAYKFANSYPTVLFKYNGSFIGYTLTDNLAGSRQRNCYLAIPSGVDQIVVQCDETTRLNIDKLTNANTLSSWVGKNILFLGTSISATGITFRDGYYTIPGYICHLLGSNAINQAKGESMIRNGYSFEKSASDPYGWTNGYWNNLAYSLSMTLSEKNELITNWESKWRDLVQGSDKPTTLTDDQKTLWRNCSYENRLLPYLNGTNTLPDLIVIEHGRNDIVWWNQGSDTFSGISSVNPDALSGFDRGLYGDALAYIIRIIREYHKDLPILLVGHFDNSGTFEHLPEEQEKAAKYNGIFFCDTTPTGWNNCKVTVTGQWSNGKWVEDGTSRVYTRRHQNLADDIHPASTLSGEPIMIEAGIVADYIQSHIVPQI